MKENIINFLRVGLYKTKEQAIEITVTNMNMTIITPQECSEIVVAIEEYFAPPVVEQMPIDPAPGIEEPVA